MAYMLLFHAVVNAITVAVMAIVQSCQPIPQSPSTICLDQSIPQSLREHLHYSYCNVMTEHSVPTKPAAGPSANTLSQIANVSFLSPG